MRRLFKFLFQLVMVAIFFFICSAAAIIFDGLNDRGAKADAALVVDAVLPVKGTNPVLDRVVEMHRTGEISSVVVISSKWLAQGQEGGAAAMAAYLVARGIPESDIVQSNHGGSLEETARSVAQIVRAREFHTLMIVADYYDVTRLKVAIGHEGVKDVQTVHLGTVSKDDAGKIIGSVVELYQYIGKVYIMPEAEKVQKEAKAGLDKAGVEAEHAKDKVNKSLDSLPK